MNEYNIQAGGGCDPKWTLEMRMTDPWILSFTFKYFSFKFSFQSQRKAMPKNAQITAQLHSSHTLVTATPAKSLQLCLTLCDPIDGSPPGFPVPGILQARTLEWATIAFSNVWKWKWSHSVVSNSWRPHGLQPTRLLCPWDFPGKSSEVGCHCLLHMSLC